MERNLSADTSQKRPRSPMNPIQNFLLNFLCVITIAWLLFGYVIGALTAPNEDMAPSILSKDLLLYYRLNRTYHAQDVVVLEKNGTTYIGRVVATGTDCVDISDDDHLLINENLVAEPDIYHATPRFEGFVTYPVQLADGAYFVLADAREGAEDSRYYGTVTQDEIRGKVFAVIRRNHL